MPNMHLFKICHYSATSWCGVVMFLFLVNETTKDLVEEALKLPLKDHQRMSFYPFQTILP